VAPHDIVTTQRRRFVGHILRLPATRAISHKTTEGDLEDQRGHGKIHWKKIWKRWVWTGVTRERLPAIMPDGDNSLPDAPLGIESDW